MGQLTPVSLGPRTAGLHPMCVKGLYFLTVLSGLAASGEWIHRGVVNSLCVLGIKQCSVKCVFKGF